MNNELVGNAPGYLQESVYPMLTYLSTLRPSSRAPQVVALTAMAKFLSKGTLTYMEYPWHKLDPLSVGLMRQWMIDHYAPKTVNRMIWCIRQVIRHCFYDGLITERRREALVYQLKLTSSFSVRPGRMITAEEIESLMKAAAESMDEANSKRNLAILTVMFETGARLNEMLMFDLKDYSNGYLYIRASKNNGYRRMPLYKSIKRIDDWLWVRGNWEGPLFTPINKGIPVKSRLSYRGGQGIIPRLCARAGLHSMTNHDTRRTFISMLLETGCDVMTAAKLAGHSSPRVTMIYDLRSVRAQEEAVERLRIPA